MGARGPRPRPTALRVIDGNPSRRPLNNGEPQAVGQARCPQHLSTVARQRWRAITRAMPPGFYTPADVGLLAAYCEAWSDHVTATKELVDGRSLIVKSGTGYAVSPLVVIRSRAAATMSTLGTRLGLSPADRAGIAAPRQETGKGGKWDGLIVS